MAELSSKLFTEGDAAAVKQLDNCANGRPSEVASHFLESGKGFQREGEAVKRLQQALKNAVDNSLALQGTVRPFEVNGVYDKAFGDAIEDFKRAKDIKNFANKIDRVVGIKTVQELDKEATRRPSEPLPPFPKVIPRPVPRALPNCTPKSDIPVSRKFQIRLIAVGSIGEVLELTKWFFAVKDVTNGLQSLYTMNSGWAGASVAPISAGGGGGFTETFDAVADTKITDFVFAQVASLTTPANQKIPPIPKVLPKGLSLDFGTIVLQYQSVDKKVHSTSLIKFDTGPSLPSGSIAGGAMKILSECKGEPGAVKRELTIDDVKLG